MELGMRLADLEDLLMKHQRQYIPMLVHFFLCIVYFLV
jgi:hypothetical protein